MASATGIDATSCVIVAELLVGNDSRKQVDVPNALRKAEGLDTNITVRSLIHRAWTTRRWDNRPNRRP